jgi:AraC-like DNA-binding protein
MSAIDILIEIVNDQWNKIKIIFAETWTIPWSVPAGERDDYEICLLEKGEGVFCVGNKEYRVKANDVIIHYSMRGNSFYPTEGTPFRFVFVTFKFIDSIDNMRIKDFGDKLDQENFPLNIGDDPETVKIFYQLHHEIFLKAAGYQFRMKPLLAILISRIMKNQEQDRRQKDSQITVNPGTRDVIDKVIIFLQKNYMHEIHLNDLGRLANVHPRYLCTLFRNIVGQTIVGYLTELRIEKAKRMLLYTSLSITEITYDTGFSNSQYFSRVFNKMVGMEPRNYRKYRGERQ